MFVAVMMYDPYQSLHRAFIEPYLFSKTWNIRRKQAEQLLTRLPRAYQIRTENRIKSHPCVYVRACACVCVCVCVCVHVC